jgi:hypothetical protein
LYDPLAEPFADPSALPDAVHIEPRVDRLVVGDDRHFTATLSRPDFTRLEWAAGGLIQPGAVPRFLGFTCVPAEACTIESVTTTSNGRSVARLQVHGATRAVVRMSVESVGTTDLSLTAWAPGPCYAPPAPSRSCELHAEDQLYIRVVDP